MACCKHANASSKKKKQYHYKNPYKEKNIIQQKEA